MDVKSWRALNLHKAIRKEIVDSNLLEAVISIASGVFKPYTGVHTVTLVFGKTSHDGTDNVWFCDMSTDGLSEVGERTAVKDNDIPNVWLRFKVKDEEADRVTMHKPLFVSAADIKENGYDLSINKYKKTKWVSTNSI